ncbi:chromatin associated protein KTI12 [Athelia psychrophila]|uniref:Chromatin associated protein KTI12 n=1 Tax=Athelia psychrophila TaxID=1759441 RepID=A0A166IH67_9AGAM|nr:chromatin associated protein KTI12 [Fibularhizoctonia sp. CBS 109695]
MALITISGYPCAGKTRRAHQLKDQLEQRLADSAYEGPKLKVAIVSDDTLNLNRNAYDESRSEKPARGALLTATQRQMGVDTILIVDALNYIKGFRYQMYCAAREHKLRVCTVYVVATKDLCRSWHEARTDGLSYTPETFENLLMRFEEPSSMVRWDSPLFSVMWEEESVPTNGIWTAITAGNIKAPNSGTQVVAKAPVDALHTLEQTTSSIVSAILSSQASASTLGGSTTLALSATLNPRISLPARNLTLSELQRYKRQFVTVHKKAITLGSTEKGAVNWSEESIADKFVDYLEENLKP